ncbi:MAG: PEGA domain-containing protein [Patescibacteria group bacterium]
MRKQLIVSALILLFLALVTIFVIIYGKGYRFNLKGSNAILSGTGLLVATSTPDGAQVLINDHLTTATDNTINLAPGEYTVKIFKEGYFTWEKNIIIKKEVVSKADALLFPKAPKLESITNIGILNPVIDPSKTKIAYLVASQSAVKNGVYILDMTSRPILTLQSASTQIANDILDYLSTSNIQWSPDSKEILAASGRLIKTTYLLETNTLNQNPKDVTETIVSVDASWNKLKTEKQKALMDSLPKKLKKVVSEQFNILEWSSDETKILYEASQSAEIPLIITPPLIGTNSTPEVRSLKKGEVYTYDIKEDRNYKILDFVPKKEDNSPLPLMWYPDSKHLVYVHSSKIDIMEYDAKNQTTIYAGPFVDGFVFPWPDATKLVILTDLGNPSITPNLYTIGLK